MEMNRLCPHCMKEVAGEKGKVCAYCGHRFGDKKEVQHQLKPFTILAGKYLVGDVLGEGGFGITYIGFDLNLEIRIAIKEFYSNGFATREASVTNELTAYTGQSMDIVYKWRDNFLREARSLAKCARLPGVVGVRDFFQENNTAYIVQELLLKPGCAPEEQYRTKGNQGLWTDIYALARTVYKCLTGIPPPESMERMRKDELQSLRELGVSIEPHVERALQKAMAVYAENRYQNVE